MYSGDRVYPGKLNVKLRRMERVRESYSNRMEKIEVDEEMDRHNLLAESWCWELVFVSQVESVVLERETSSTFLSQTEIDPVNYELGTL